MSPFCRVRFGRSKPPAPAPHAELQRGLKPTFLYQHRQLYHDAFVSSLTGTPSRCSACTRPRGKRERGRKRERKRNKGRASERESERERENVCVRERERNARARERTRDGVPPELNQIWVIRVGKLPRRCGSQVYQPSTQPSRNP